MIQRIKQRLARVNASSIRYRFVHTMVKDENIRRAKACTFYWVYIPMAVAAWLLMPFFMLIWFVIIRPVVWAVGYTRTDNPIGMVDPEADPNDPLSQNAHKGMAPWRAIVPVLVLVALVIFALNGGLTFEVIWLTCLAIVGIIAFGVWRYHKAIAMKWDKICPKLEVLSEET